ncbi:MAG: Terminase-like family protein [bacterium ADurb.Bin236]|nr:MAG: Terminase-like family protein [bacterium ADurb.Bin236]HOY61633.1 hypothetical protein [bacterium]
MAKKKKYTKRALDADLAQIRKALKVEAAPFENDTPEAKAERIKRAGTDLIYFLKTYFPHYCRNESPEYHSDLAALIETMNKPIAVTAPRGGAKSVIASFAKPLQEICYSTMRFMLIISDTNALAADFIEFIKLEIEENERLRNDFGDLRGKRKWQSDDIVTANGIRILGRGFKQRIRGLRHGAYRPDRVVLDDYEKDEEQSNPKILDKKETWIKATVIPALEPDGWRLVYVGTILSPGSVLARFMDGEQSPEWLRKNYEASDEEITWSFWPARFSVEKLRSIRSTIGTRAYNQEYRGIAVDEASQKFPRKWFKRERPLLTKELVASQQFIVTYTDASAKAEEHNDYKAIVVLGWDGSRYTALYCWMKHATTTEMMSALYEFKQRFGTASNGMEEVAFQSLFRDLLKLFGKEKGYQIPLQMRGRLESKAVRIGSLEPLIENGQLVFCADGEMDCGDMDLLIDQFVYWPNTNVNDDGPDAVDGAVWLAQYLGAGAGGSGKFEELGGRRAGDGMFSDAAERRAKRRERRRAA